MSLRISFGNRAFQTCQKYQQNSSVLIEKAWIAPWTNISIETTTSRITLEMPLSVPAHHDSDHDEYLSHACKQLIRIRTPKRSDLQQEYQNSLLWRWKYLVPRVGTLSTLLVVAWRIDMLSGVWHKFLLVAANHEENLTVRLRNTRVKRLQGSHEETFVEHNCPLIRFSPVANCCWYI